MREIVITTESGSDMPQKLTEEFNVHVVPMHVIIDDVDYADGTIPVDRVFEYYESTGKVPTTSAVNVGEYDEFFAKLQKEHPGCVIFNFCYTSKASSTYQSAAISVKNFKDVYLIDTKMVSGGCTAHIIACRNMIAEELGNDNLMAPDDYDFASLVDKCQALADKACCHFIPNTLEYLKAGGRCSNAQYLGATILNLKPLIEMIDGKLVTTKKYRGSMRRWVDRFIDDFTTKYDLRKDCLYLMYGKGLAQDVLDRMAERAKELGFHRWEYVMTGCVISCHGGKGAIGLAGIQK